MYGTPVDSARGFEILLVVEAIAFLAFLGLLVRRAISGSPASGADVAVVVLRVVVFILSAALVAGAAMLVAWFVSGLTLPRWMGTTAGDPDGLSSAYAWVFVCVYGSVIMLLLWFFRRDRGNQRWTRKR